MPRSMPLSSVAPPAAVHPAPIAGEPTAPIDQAAVADYIFDLSGELAGLAKTSGLELLAYLLDMVRLEAGEVKRRATPNRRGDPPSD